MSNTIVCCGMCSNKQPDAMNGKLNEQGLIGCRFKPVWQYGSATRPRECTRFVLDSSEAVTRRAA